MDAITKYHSPHHQRNRKAVSSFLANAGNNNKPIGDLSAIRTAPKIDYVSDSVLNSKVKSIRGNISRFNLVKGHVDTTKLYTKKADFNQYNYSPAFNIENAVLAINSSPDLSIEQKENAIAILNNASGLSHGPYLTIDDLIGGAVAAGMGYLQGVAIAKTLGAIIGLDQNSQKRIGQAGIIGGLLSYTGLLR